ncbi:MAG: PEP-CTERM sorting domain-containing protein [Puniceicoccales bacterium]|jgi:predicted outer membrane repeat protein|nr:PEP-CTERM sorting domain-containing protein [Puniceicoccales bacterium]
MPLTRGFVPDNPHVPAASKKGGRPEAGTDRISPKKFNGIASSDYSNFRSPLNTNELRFHYSALKNKVFFDEKACAMVFLSNRLHRNKSNTMNTKRRIPTTTAAHALRRAHFLSAASLLLPLTWTPPHASAVSVTRGENLRDHVNNTNRNATFDLSGNVKWSTGVGNTGNAISANSDMVINSNGNTITQDNGGSWLNYTGGTQHVLTLKNTLVQGDSNYGSGQWGLFHASNTSMTVALVLEGSTFDGFKGYGSDHSGSISFSYYKAALVVDGGQKGVIFSNNKGASGSNDGAGVFGTHQDGSSLTLKGNTTFTGNSTMNYGGALTIDAETGNTTLAVNIGNDGKVVFDGNSSQGFGGAINFWGYNTSGTFGGEALFQNNWTQGNGSGIDDRSKRGGAINVGFMNGQSDINFREKVTFTGNRAIGIVATDKKSQAWGGALSVTAQGTGLGTTNGTYSVIFEKAAEFKNNYVTSAASGDYKVGNGGAVYVGVGTSTNTKSVRFGAGSLFEGNLAQTKGGAIYVSAISGTADSGGRVTLNADSNGHITFKDNYEGVVFTKVSDTNYTRDGTSGTRNAIHFAGNGVLNINATGTSAVHFYDPITGGQNSASNLVTVSKTGDGDVIFYGNDSKVHAETTVRTGRFVLKNGASYGDTTSVAQAVFTVGTSGVLVGERETAISANKFVASSGAELQLAAEGGPTGRLTISSQTTPSIHNDARLLFEIKGTDDTSRNAGKLGFSGSAPTFTEANAPEVKLDTSQWTEDLSILTNPQYVSITLIEGFGYNGLIQNGSVIGPGVFGLTYEELKINGGKFRFQYANSNLLLNQFDVYPIPEPTTYALLGGLGAVALAVMRRRRRRA